MAKIAPKRNQDTLDSLRRIRRLLYSIPESELSAMSLEDQILYGESLYDTTIAISKLEITKLREVNDAFKAEEKNLMASTLKLETDLSDLKFITDFVRVASKALSAISKIIELV